MIPFPSFYLCALLVTLSLGLAACTSSTPSQTTSTHHVATPPIVRADFQQLLDSMELQGAITFYDLHSEQWYTNDWDATLKEARPASTFKIPNSMIALETGVVKDTSTLFVWDGQPRALKRWEQDLTFLQAMHRSCVPCYQEIAQKIGLTRMQSYLKKLDFGTMRVDSATLTNFWLSGDSWINSLQQINFLQRWVRQELPLKPRTYALMQPMLQLNDSLYGKTGYSASNTAHTGWFVGYFKSSKQRPILFAIRLEAPADNVPSAFAEGRTYLALAAYRRLYSTLF